MSQATKLYQVIGGAESATETHKPGFFRGQWDRALERQDSEEYHLQGVVRSDKTENSAAM